MKRANGRIVEDVPGRELDASHDVSAPAKELVRIAEASGPGDKQRATPRACIAIEEDRFGGTLGRAVSDHEEVVVVVDKLERAREELLEFRAGFASDRGDFGK